MSMIVVDTYHVKRYLVPVVFKNVSVPLIRKRHFSAAVVVVFVLKKNLSI
jgi:hypothetical protein